MLRLNVGFILVAMGFAGPVVHAQSTATPNAPKSSKVSTATKTVVQPTIVAMKDVPAAAVATPLPSVEREKSEPKKLEVKLGMLLEGSSLRDDNSERRDVVYTAIVPKLKLNLTEMIFIDLQPKFKFRAGHIQGASPSNGRESTVTLSKAEFTFTDANFFRVSAGALDTSEFLSPILMDTALPGGLVTLSSGLQNTFAVGAFGIGGVPGSSTKSDVSDEVDKTPSFTSAGFYARLKTDPVFASLTASSFEYRNLPSSVANDSVKLGNTGLGNPLTPIQKLQYQFRGLELRGQFDWKVSSRLEWKSWIAGQKNQEAPNELNTGLGGRAELHIGVTNGWNLIPGYGYYNVQPDAVVANFNDDRINTNRVGYEGSLFVQYKKLFKVGGFAGERTLVFENPAQGRETFAGIQVEVLDASF